MSCFQKYEWALSDYCHISLLRIISELLKSIIKEKIVDHLNINNNLLSDKLYAFCSCSSIVYVLTIITHRISEVFTNKLLTTATLPYIFFFFKIIHQIQNTNPQQKCRKHWMAVSSFFLEGRFISSAHPLVRIEPELLQYNVSIIPLGQPLSVMN